MSISPREAGISGPLDGVDGVNYGKAPVDDILAPAARDVISEAGIAGAKAAESNPAPAAKEIVDQGVMAADESGVNPLELVPGPEQPVAPEL